MTLAAKPYLQGLRFKSDSELNFDHYPYAIAAVQELEKLEFDADVTFFVGENGAGKSTVLEAIALAYGFSAEGGTLNVRQNSVDSCSDLHQHLRLQKSFAKPRDAYFLRDESFFNIATYMDEVGYTAGYGGSLHERSHGEAFMALLLNKLKGQGLYLFDEPEAALSPNRQFAALSAIDQLVKQASQFIIATHSPILLAYPHAKIYQFDRTGITRVNYEDTEHYALTRDFLNHYPKRLQQLLKHDHE